MRWQKTCCQHHFLTLLDAAAEPQTVLKRSAPNGAHTAQPFTMTTHPFGGPSSPNVSPSAELGLLSDLYLLLMASMTSRKLLPQRPFYFEQENE